MARKTEYSNMLEDMALLRDTLREHMGTHRNDSSAWSYIRGDDGSIWCHRYGGIRYFYSGVLLDIEFVPDGYDVARGWYLIATDGYSPGAGDAARHIRPDSEMATYDLGPFETLQLAATTLYHMLTMHPETIGE